MGQPRILIIDGNRAATGEPEEGGKSEDQGVVEHRLETEDEQAREPQATQENRGHSSESTVKQ